MTFNNLLPGDGEPLKTQYVDQQQEILFNWRSDHEEESFPRGEDSVQSSGKKRKASSKEKYRKKKVKESGEMEKHEESGSREERSSKKKS
ncbi:hypothetical protein Patl1_04649 [Pistacia atlantica]|uniref:Uncharacterized protein n=1 Tax=Pistacia atlantica TaxID=434234 RepID=A0ACC1BVU6_9ROSI|nr:hypothetical protein Patl1_04649 [Pistacia atlantica]